MRREHVGKTMKAWRIALQASLLLLLTCASSNAQNLVVNPGFETGDLTGWTFIAASSGSDFYVSTLYPHSGSYDAAFGAVGNYDDSILQAVPTTPGQSYTISFWLIHPTGESANDFSAYWDGNELMSSSPPLPLLNADEFSYTQYTFTEPGDPSTSTTVLEFSGREVPAWFYLDDVSVTAVGVPEPATILLLGFGLFGLAGVRREFKK